MTGFRSLVPKSDFVGLEHFRHLCTGGEAPMLASHRAVLERFLVDKSDGMAGRNRILAMVESCRRRVADFIGMQPAEIAFLINSSDGLVLAVQALVTEPGDNVVLAHNEYHSLALALQPLLARGVEIRYAGRDAVPELADYEALVDKRTRAILVSQVSHLTGNHVDLPGLRRLADTVGARLIVDASHALGVVPVPVELCDVIVSACYKWLLGVHGVGILAVNARRWPELPATSLGWHSIQNSEGWVLGQQFQLHVDARRFETGNPPTMPLAILDNALAATGMLSAETRAEHARALGGKLRDGLLALGLPVLTPAEWSRRAGNYTFLHPEPFVIEAKLRSEGVLAWAGEGRVRLSVHLYNDLEDVAAGVAALGRVL